MKIKTVYLIIPSFFFNSCAFAQTQYSVQSVANFFDQSIPFSKIENYNISDDGSIALIYEGYHLSAGSLIPNDYSSYLCLDLQSKDEKVEKHTIKLFKISNVFRNGITCYTNGNDVVAVASHSLKNPDLGVYNINQNEVLHKNLPNTKLQAGFMGCFDPQNRFYLIDQTNDSLRCRIFNTDYKTMNRKNFVKNVEHLKKIYWDNDNDYYLTYTYQNAAIHSNHLIIAYGMQKVPHDDNRPAWEKQNIAELVGIETVDLESQTVSDLQYWELPEIAIKKTLQADYAKVKMLTADNPSISMKIFIGGQSEDIPGIFEIHLDNTYQPIKYTQMQKGEPAAVAKTAPLQDYRLLDLVYNRRRDELSLLMIDKSSIDTATPLTRFTVQ